MFVHSFYSLPVSFHRRIHFEWTHLTTKMNIYRTVYMVLASHPHLIHKNAAHPFIRNMKLNEIVSNTIGVSPVVGRYCGELCLQKTKGIRATSDLKQSLSKSIHSFNTRWPL